MSVFWFVNILHLGKVTDVKVINGTVVWNPPDETGRKITEYNVRFFDGNGKMHDEKVTGQWYTPPESVQYDGPVTVGVRVAIEYAACQSSLMIPNYFLFLVGPGYKRCRTRGTE